MDVNILCPFQLDSHPSFTKMPLFTVCSDLDYETVLCCLSYNQADGRHHMITSSDTTSQTSICTPLRRAEVQRLKSGLAGLSTTKIGFWWTLWNRCTSGTGLMDKKKGKKSQDSWAFFSSYIFWFSSVEDNQKITGSLKSRHPSNC